MLKSATPYLLFGIYKSFVTSWRITVDESPAVQELVKQNKSFVIAHWHGDEMGILHLLKPYNVACIISTSKDGELMNRVVQLMGAETVRGSSTRGGSQALKGILRLTKKGRRPSVAVDGPKGPLHKAKPGIFQISRLTQLPIVPISFYASDPIVFSKSWNKAELPKPFSKVSVAWGDPLPAVSRDMDSKDPLLARQLEEALHATKKRARELVSS